MSKSARVFSGAFKTAAVARVRAGERTAAIAADLRIRPKLLYEWLAVVRAGGSLAPRPRGRHAELATALARIAELERKIGRQQMELDFFRAALRRTKGRAQTNETSGATASTPSSKR